MRFVHCFDQINYFILFLMIHLIWMREIICIFLVSTHAHDDMWPVLRFDICVSFTKSYYLLLGMCRFCSLTDNQFCVFCVAKWILNSDMKLWWINLAFGSVSKFNSKTLQTQQLYTDNLTTVDTEAHWSFMCFSYKLTDNIWWCWKEHSF